MKIKNLIKKIKENEENLKKIKIKTFIPMLEKRVLTDNVVSLTVSPDENNIMSYDMLFQEVLLNIYKVLYFTDIDLDLDLDHLFADDDVELMNKCLIDLNETYDLLVESKLMQYIDEQFENDDLEQIINKKTKLLMDGHNSVANVMKTFIEKLPSQEDIGNLMSSLPNQMNDLKNLKILNTQKDGDKNER